MIVISSLIAAAFGGAVVFVKVMLSIRCSTVTFSFFCLDDTALETLTDISYVEISVNSYVMSDTSKINGKHRRKFQIYRSAVEI